MKKKKIQLLEENGDYYVLDCATGEYINPVAESPRDAFDSVCEAGGMDTCDNVSVTEDADAEWPNARIIAEKRV